MPDLSPAARRTAFAAFVRRALDRAQLSRGWSMSEVARRAEIGPSTVSRWTSGDWQTSPNADQVAAFCRALDIPPSLAFAILWPDPGARAAAPEAPPADPDVDALLRELADPRTTRERRHFVRETLRLLAQSRPAPGARKAG